MFFICFKDSYDSGFSEPSAVVSVTELSPLASESDLIDVLSNFGLVSYVVVIPDKNEALVEFEVSKLTKLQNSIQKHYYLFCIILSIAFFAHFLLDDFLFKEMCTFRL